MQTTTTISFINQKGGCGKSSSCFHLGGQFAKLGHRVLLIDADPQGSLSQAFFGSAAIETLKSEETLAAIFPEDWLPEVASLVVPTSFENLWMVRANALLGEYNIPVPEKSGMKQFALLSCLSGKHNFDLILIDCPPNLYQCSWNALLASTHVVVPVPPEDFATQGLRAVHQAIDQARNLNRRLQLLGHLVIRADTRLLIHRKYEEQLRKRHGDSVFATMVPEASAFKVSLSCRQPVPFHSPNSRAFEAIRLLADEMLQKIMLGQRGRRIA